MWNNQIIRIVILATLAALVASCGNNRKMKGGIDSKDNYVDEYYAGLNDTLLSSRKDEIIVKHYWREIEPGDYLFGEPDDCRIEEWKNLCSGETPEGEHVSPKSLIGYKSINQYVTVQDLYSLWYYDSTNRYNDELSLWRLEQYDTASHSPASERERFDILKTRIQSLCDFEPQFQIDLNNHAGFLADFQEFISRLFFKEVISNSDSLVVMALMKENEEWLNYHAAVDSAFRIIDGDPSGRDGSSWSMAISGIRGDDAMIREHSLSDYLFHLKGELDDCDIVRHVTVSDQKVLREYRRFMSTFKDDEYSYTPAERRAVLGDEMDAWKRWMDVRDSVSGLLSGSRKAVYDNCTNNVRRMKYIMLKNRYEGYGVTSDDVWRMRIPYTVPDEDLDGPPFDERWKAYLDSLDNR